MRKLLVILGTPVDDINMEEALDRIETFIAIGRATGKGHQIATINADFVVKSLHDPELRRILQEADLATADGMPLVWSARLLDVPLQDRVTGADMVPALAQRAAEKGYSIYFLGAAPGVAAQAATILQTQYPDLRIAGIAAPSPSAVQNGDPAIIAACRAAKPDILLVAFGNPKQEKWIYHHARQLGVPVMMGVGGTFDFIAGVTKRAPRWMQQTGLEWLYRLVCEPRRLWKRYATDLIGFGAFFLWQWWTMRQRTTTPTVLPLSDTLLVKDTVILNVQGRLDRSNQRPFAEKAFQSLGDTPWLIVNLAQAEFLDSSAIGTLVALTKQAREADGNLWLAHVPPTIQRVLALLRLEEFFDICTDVEEALQARRGQRRLNIAAIPLEGKEVSMIVSG
ncbi:MAG: WecB/TagA/CpsF family glycosyltransferase [Caldilineaceae bacterium]